jgi:tRNA threonylcarbamoyladenosine biosynthesis protein TsaB
MHSYIIIHHTSDTFEVALFINNKLHEHHREDKRLASKRLIPLIDAILTSNNLMLAHLSFIGINQGPGLFSTLRSIIATANGLYFAANIPLVGIDALNATALEFYEPAYEYNVTLLNACNNEVYYTITDHKKIIAQGYDTIEHFLHKLTQYYPNNAIRFIGNGTDMYQEIIKNTTGINAIIPEIIPQLCSIEMIATLAQEKYDNGECSSYLFPLHLKKHAVER